MGTLTTLERTQVHEAGHVVAARWARNLKPLRLVVADLTGGSCGTIEQRDNADPETALYECARTLVAGAVAELLACGDSRGHGTDLDELVRIALQWETLTGRRDSAHMVRKAFAGSELLLRLCWGEVQSLARMLSRAGGLTPELIETCFDRACGKPKIDDWDHLKLLIRQARGDRQIETVFANLRLPPDRMPKRAAESRTTVTRKIAARRQPEKSFARRLEEKLAERRGRRKPTTGTQRGYVAPDWVRM